MSAVAYYVGPDGIKEGVGKYIDSSIIQTSDTDIEFRVKRAPLARRGFSFSWVTSQVPTVERMFELFGTHTSFLLRPPRLVDYSETNQVCSPGTGDGTNTQFQLQITRTLGSKSGSKKVMHPRTGTVKVYVAGALKTETTHYTVDYATGIVTFTAGNIPAAAAAVTVDFDYDTPVRFLSDSMEVKILQGFGAIDQETETNTTALIEVFDE
jgi:uncharacterized protein (TIGR02217 family)